MPFTTVQLATQMDDPRLAQWADSNPQNQGPFLIPFTTYFAGIQAWITANGGANPFGWNDVAGLTHRQWSSSCSTRPPTDSAI